MSEGSRPMADALARIVADVQQGRLAKADAVRLLTGLRRTASSPESPGSADGEPEIGRAHV